MLFPSCPNDFVKSDEIIFSCFFFPPGGIIQGDISLNENFLVKDESSPKMEECT